MKTFKRVSFRCLSSELPEVFLDVDVDNQDDFERTLKNLSYLMGE